VGTVVERKVIHPFAFESVIQSQAGLVGTARACHYIVLENETGYIADELQKSFNQSVSLGHERLYRSLLLHLATSPMSSSVSVTLWFMALAIPAIEDTATPTKFKTVSRRQAWNPKCGSFVMGSSHPLLIWLLRTPHFFAFLFHYILVSDLLIWSSIYAIRICEVH